MRIELLFPPIAFVILLAAAIFLSALCSRLSFRKKDSSDESKRLTPAERNSPAI